MKKFTLLAATALVSLTAAAQVAVGLERPTTDGVYDAFTSTDAYLKSADGLTVSFYESEEIAAVRTTENTKNLYHQGVAVPSDFAWNLTCTNTNGFYGADGHADDAKFPENYNFGFKLNVPAGKSLSVDAVSFDLLVNANPTWRVRILDASQAELYNSGNMNKYNGFRNNLSVGNRARITASELDMTYEEGANAENAQTAATAALEAGFQLLPADFTLAAGEYTVLLDFDYNTKTQNPLSFDSFTIEGTLTSVATDESPVVGIVRPTTGGAYDAFTSTDAYLKSADGLTVSFYESEEIAAVRTTENTKNLYHQGVAVPSDFAWNLTCTNTNGFYGADGHADDAKFPENYNFGFKLNVPAGKSLSVDAVSFDLLVNANPTWRVRILDASQAELYNSGNMNKYNGFRNNLSVGNRARITATELDMTYEEGANTENAQTAATSALEAGFQLLPADFTLAAGEYTVLLDFDYNTKTQNPLSFDSFTIEGTLNDAGDAESTTVTYALQVGETHASGETVEVKDATGEAVATLTFGEEGGADFGAAKANSAIEGFVAFTEGNGTNGNKAGGTFYTIVPKYDGEVTVGVVMTANKSFFVLEDGTALDDYNGITVDEKYYGTFTFDVKAGKSYKFYCSGSKLGFYGFQYTSFGSATAIETVQTRQTAEQGNIYNLRGQRVQAPQRGQLYIMNGRKFMAR